MSTTVAKGRVRTISTTSKSVNVSLNAQTLAAAIADFEVQIYGAGSTPLYDLVSSYGLISVSNTIDSAYQSFAEVKAELKDGEAGYIYSEEYNRFTLAIKVPGSGIVFAGLLHDKNGSPRVESELMLTRVAANRDFEQDGVTIIKKGEEFLKALPKEYGEKLKKAA